MTLAKPESFAPTAVASEQLYGASSAARSMQLVSFRLDGELYGLQITKIREIILVGEITRVPETPPYIKGLINLRSSVIPVIDLRARFGLPESAPTDDSRIMVLNVARKTIGIMVDSVNEVLRVAQEQVSPAPPTIASLGREYVTALVRLDEQLLILLDADRLFAEEPAVREVPTTVLT